MSNIDLILKAGWNISIWIGNKIEASATKFKSPDVVPSLFAQGETAEIAIQKLKEQILGKITSVEVGQ
jgi:hypothetical protein